jgi:hypothetical protein
VAVTGGPADSRQSERAVVGPSRLDASPLPSLPAFQPSDDLNKVLSAGMLQAASSSSSASRSRAAGWRRHDQRVPYHSGAGQQGKGEA